MNITLDDKVRHLQDIQLKLGELKHEQHSCKVCILKDIKDIDLDILARLLSVEDVLRLVR